MEKLISKYFLMDDGLYIKKNIFCCYWLVMISVVYVLVIIFNMY